MTVRCVCDLCGNFTGVNFYRATFNITSFNHDFNSQAYPCSNPAHGHLEMQAIQRIQFGQQAQAQGIGIASSPPPVITPSKHIDLCQHCAPIWEQRVRNITQISDPKK